MLPDFLEGDYHSYADIFCKYCLSCSEYFKGDLKRENDP